MTKNIMIEDISYEISNEISTCGDCTICENRCETGINIISATWSPEEVEEVCSLLKPSPYLSKLKNLEEMR